MYKVYQLLSPSGKSYVGYTQNDPEKRFKQHCTAWRRWIKIGRPRKMPRGGSIKLYYAFDSYSPDQWIMSVLGTFAERQSALDYEYKIIKESNTISTGYNQIPGGFGGKGRILDTEHRQKISDARKRYYETEDGQRWLCELADINRNRPSRAKPKIRLSDREKSQRQSETMKQNWVEGKIKYIPKPEGWKQTENQKKVVSAKLSATWEIMHPDGNVEVVTNLKQWSIERGFNPKYCQANMSGVGTYKGYRATKTFDPSGRTYNREK